MSQLGIDLRTFLLADTAIAAAVSDRVHESAAPEQYQGLYLWFSRSGSDPERVLNESAGTDPFREYFDLEAIGRDLEAVQDLADELRDLDASRGSFGTGGRIQALWIEDQSDDYVPRGLADDELGFHVSAFRLEIVGYVPA